MSLSLTDTIFILVFILFVYCLYLQCSRNNEPYNNYQSHQDYQTINNKCFDYVMTDGKYFYLYKVRKPYEKDENPLIFKTKVDVINYLKKIGKQIKKKGFKVKYIVATPVPDPKPLKNRGYSPIISIPSDGFTRSLYQIENNEDAIYLACNLHDNVPGRKVIRSIMVSRE